MRFSVRRRRHRSPADLSAAGQPRAFRAALLPGVSVDMLDCSGVHDPLSTASAAGFDFVAMCSSAQGAALRDFFARIMQGVTTAFLWRDVEQLPATCSRRYRWAGI